MATPSKKIMKKFDTPDMKFINTSDYLLMSKQYLDYQNDIKEKSSIVNVEINKNIGYIVNNKKVNINMTPNITVNINDMIDIDVNVNDDRDNSSDDDDGM